MARLYADENFPLPVVEQLRVLGHKVLTSHEDGKANQRIPDEEVLATAAGLRRTLLTTNRRHFIRLHQQSSSHYGIIVCTYDLNFVGQASRIDHAIRQEHSLIGNLIRVNRPPRASSVLES